MYELSQAIERPLSYRIWAVGAFFVLFQFFLQLSSGVVIGVIMLDFKLSALTTGLLSSAFYIIYTGLQIPVGILLDRYNPRYLLTFNALLCSCGCLLFATSSHLSGLFCGRILMGGGAAFAFVGLTHLVRQYFPLSKFAFVIGFSETLGFLATVLGIISLGRVIYQVGWRNFMECAALIGFIIAFLCWRIIPNETDKPKPGLYGQQLTCLLTNKRLWINGLFIGLSFALVTVFGALWAVPFLQIKLACSLRQASLLTSFFFLGTGLSCPLFGFLSNHLRHRRPLIIYSFILTVLLLLCLLYVNNISIVLAGFILFGIGLSCGGYIIAYPIANELAPPKLLSTSAGFTNTLALITTPILQPLIGFVLDWSATRGHYMLADYQRALIILPISLLCASILVVFLPEKK